MRQRIPLLQDSQGSGGILMSKLKAITVIDAYQLECDDNDLVYIKSEADAEIRRLKRALWRAIALFCARSCEYFSGIMSHCLMAQDDLYKKCEEKKNKDRNLRSKRSTLADSFVSI